MDSLLTICLLLDIDKLHYIIPHNQSASLTLQTLHFHREDGEGTKGTVPSTVAYGIPDTEQSRESRFMHLGKE